MKEIESLKLTYTKIPKNFSLLCRLNMSESNYRSYLDKFIVRDPFTYLVFKKALNSKNEGRELEQIMMSSSWTNIRDRLTSLYVGKLFYGVYPNSIQLDLIEDIKDIENQFLDYQLDGFSRVFLLATFIKFHNLQSLSFDSLGDHQIELHSKIKDILILSKIKIEKLDYLILLLHHLLHFLGFDEAQKMILSGLNFQQIYEALKVSERKMIHDNFLSYSTSIHEPDFFLFDKV